MEWLISSNCFGITICPYNPLFLIKFGTSLSVKINNYYMDEAMKMRILIDSLSGPNFQYGSLRWTSHKL